MRNGVRRSIFKLIALGVLGIILSWSNIVSSSVAYAECVDLEIAGRTIEICGDSGGVSADAGVASTNVYKYSSPPAWRIEVSSFGSVAQLNFEINSGGPYQDELIMEICVTDPTFVKASFLKGGKILDFQVGKHRCGSWIRLGGFSYPG